MNEQLSIPVPGLVDELHSKPDRKLGPRQEFILRRIRERGGIETDEAGALLHADRGKHPPDTRCRWCEQEGSSVLVSLRNRKLVIRRRTGLWELRNALDYERPSAQLSTDDPFPEGF